MSTAYSIVKYEHPPYGGVRTVIAICSDAKTAEAFCRDEMVCGTWGASDWSIEESDPSTWGFEKSDLDEVLITAEMVMFEQRVDAAFAAYPVQNVEDDDEWGSQGVKAFKSIGLSLEEALAHGKSCGARPEDLAVFTKWWDKVEPEGEGS